MSFKGYTTEGAKIEAQKPQQLNGKTADEIVIYLQGHFKTEMELDDQGRLVGQTPLNKTTAYMMAVYQALFDPSDWRNPFYAIHPDCGSEWATAAIIWYHGARGHQTFAGVQSPGYQCW